MIVTEPSGEKFYVYQLGETLEQAETQIILLVYENNSYNKTHAARALGMAHRTFTNRLKYLAARGWKDPFVYGETIGPGTDQENDRVLATEE
jgi:DNA-binding NtrC family response regulator